MQRTSKKAASTRNTQTEIQKVAQEPAQVKKANPSRKELADVAKAKGLKYWRIMRREELAEAIKEETTQARITEIRQAAIARWKQCPTFARDRKE